jgi:hypothetical protein
VPSYYQPSMILGHCGFWLQKTTQVFLFQAKLKLKDFPIARIILADFTRQPMIQKNAYMFSLSWLSLYNQIWLNLETDCQWLINITKLENRL